ncbi:XTP/dITP diphosphatase [Candidatus Micrarchaeota archaeon]|nr:XTP/dITP diphosphatase [Candidatus Micrarchaeota archaeon]
MPYEIYFATGNPDKFREAKEIFGKNAAGMPLNHFQFAHREIRSDSLEEIAREAVSAAHAQLGRPVFVEDSGLFIDALNGFPGTYSAWVQGKLGNRGLLKLLESEPDRAARFEACIAFNDGKTTRIFHGACNGTIAEKEHGRGGFGYDPIFVPKGESSTFAENIELKNKYSHRYKSLLALISYLKI